MSKIQDALKKQMEEISSQLETIKKVEENSVWIEFTVASTRCESLATDHPESQVGILLGTPRGQAKLTVKGEDEIFEKTASELVSVETHWGDTELQVFEAKYDEIPPNRNGNKAVTVKIAVEKTIEYTDSTGDGSPRAILKVIDWDGELRPSSRNIVVPKNKKEADGWTAAAREKREATRTMNRVTPTANAPMSAPMDQVAPTPTPTSTKGKGFGQTV